MRLAASHLPARSNDGPDQLFSIAAPVLAGFAITVLGVLVPLNPPSLVRFRDIAILIVTGAAFLYVASMRYAIISRSLRVSDSQAVEIWPNGDERNRALRVYRRAHDQLADASRLLFGLASSAFGAGITVLLIPSGPLDEIGTVRVVTILGAGLATAAQLAQMAVSRLKLSFLPRWLVAIITPELVVAASLPESNSTE